MRISDWSSDVCSSDLALTEASVVDDEFWSLVEVAGVTGLAGVPHTFDLLERTGFADRSLPTLRYVTQAGGRLAPERVRALHRFGRRNRSEERRVGNECASTCRSRGSPDA